MNEMADTIAKELLSIADVSAIVLPSLTGTLVSGVAGVVAGGTSIFFLFISYLYT